MISALISVKFIYARYSLQHGHNIPSTVNGVATLPVVPTPSKIVSKKLKTQKNPSLKLTRLIRIINGSTTLSIASLLKRRPQSLSVSCKKMRRYLREITFQLISWSLESSLNVTGFGKSTKMILC